MLVERLTRKVPGWTAAPERMATAAMTGATIMGTSTLVIDRSNRCNCPGHGDAGSARHQLATKSLRHQNEYMPRKTCGFSLSKRSQHLTSRCSGSCGNIAA